MADPLLGLPPGRRVYAQAQKLKRARLLWLICRVRIRKPEEG
jgi:hypothetical protein